MKIEQLLQHHGIAVNPFADEDAQTDPVFKDHCITSTHHPSWGKIYGDPSEPATALVFGEKGSGKTALRLQIVRHLCEYNDSHPDAKLWVIEYDDFNPFLDRFRTRLSTRRREPAKALELWKLWDHMDAILSLGVTGLVDSALGRTRDLRGDWGATGPLPLRSLDRSQSRDLLLLAACYDQSTSETFFGRWQRLRRKLHFRTWRSHGWKLFGLMVTALVTGIIAGQQKWDWLAAPWPYLFLIAGWLPEAVRAARRYWLARGIVRQLRVVNHAAGPLWKALLRFTSDELANQPLPNKERTDDRYELLVKLQGVLRTLGYRGIIVLVDRVDEPHLITGRPELMKLLLWPMLDNKFLKHPGIGFKLLLPIELSYYIDREQAEFYQRARLDKQNLVDSLDWTGEALYDVANARLQACASDGQKPKLRDLFDPAIADRRLLDALRLLRVPRHMFKFMYRVLMAHANAHTEDVPVWKIAPETFESTLALYQRDQEAFERGLGKG
ncbi:MAG: hypothetical protein K2Y37_04420 [Pirellulales bacterium]|nr:hypothetical protein [Pirellulales bacterium]